MAGTSFLKMLIFVFWLQGIESVNVLLLSTNHKKVYKPALSKPYNTPLGAHIMTIETVEGRLASAYRLLRPETILHVDELTKERRTNSVTPDGNLRNQWFYTADGEVYSLQGEKNIPTLAITRGSSNPLFQDSTIDVYCQQLLENNNYRPTPEETERVLHAEDTVVIDLTRLTLQKGDKESSYLAIDTGEYKTLNSEEKKLAQRVYGKDYGFTQAMTMLADAHIKETRVWVLNPEYVRIYAQESPLGRASWLYNFHYNSDFDTSDRCIGGCSRARGVRREVVVASKSSEK